MNLNCRGYLIDLTTPAVMGILNATPDSFFDGGKWANETAVANQVDKMLREGADIIDIGGMSSRPKAIIISEDEELDRILPPILSIRHHFPEAIISVDTMRSRVAEEALQAGVHIVNDISAGRFDEQMMGVAAKYGSPFIIMHMKGMPDHMQDNPVYNDVLSEVTDFLAERTVAARNAGIKDIMIDPGFGFGKTVEHNYTLLKNMHRIAALGIPVLAGLSRKSLICKVLHVNPDKALNGTTAVNTMALLNGANMLRVHDVKEAKETIKLFEAYRIA